MRYIITCTSILSIEHCAFIDSTLFEESVRGSFIYIYSQLSQRWTPLGPSYRDARLRESDKESKDRDELLVSVLQRCPSYRECIEVSVTSESTVVTDRYFCQGIGKAAEKELKINFNPTEL